MTAPRVVVLVLLVLAALYGPFGVTEGTLQTVSLAEDITGVDFDVPAARGGSVGDIAQQISALSRYGSTAASVGTDVAVAVREGPDAMAERMIDEDRLESGWDGTFDRYRAHRVPLQAAVWGVPLSVAMLALAALYASLHFLTRAFSTLGMHAAFTWLVGLSTVVAAVSLSTGRDAWLEVPVELLLVPVFWLVGSASILRLIDENAPVWNKLVQGLSAPIASAVLIAGIRAYFGSA